MSRQSGIFLFLRLSPVALSSVRPPPIRSYCTPVPPSIKKTFLFDWSRFETPASGDSSILDLVCHRNIWVGSCQTLEPLNDPLYTRSSLILLVIFSQLVLDVLRHYVIFSPEFCLRISFQWIFFIIYVMTTTFQLFKVLLRLLSLESTCLS